MRPGVIAGLIVGGCFVAAVGMVGVAYLVKARPESRPTPVAPADTRSPDRGAAPVTRLADAPPTTPAGPAAGDARRVRRYADGNFARQPDGSWLEKAVDGPHRFREVARTARYVELEDTSRGIWVRLHDTQSEFRQDRSEFRHLYDGRWDSAR